MCADATSRRQPAPYQQLSSNAPTALPRSGKGALRDKTMHPPGFGSTGRSRTARRSARLGLVSWLPAAVLAASTDTLRRWLACALGRCVIMPVSRGYEQRCPRWQHVHTHAHVRGENERAAAIMFTENNTRTQTGEREWESGLRAKWGTYEHMFVLLT